LNVQRFKPHIIFCEKHIINIAGSFGEVSENEIY